MKPIKVDHDALDQGHRDLRQIAGELDQELDGLRARLARISWQGRDGDTYRSRQREWDAAVSDLNRILDDIGARVGYAREQHLATEADVRELWG